jgi:hypothetical protein
MVRRASLLASGWLALTLLASGSAAHAQEAAPPPVSEVTVKPPRIGGATPTSQGCAAAAGAATTAGCAALRLGQAAKAAQDRAKDDPSLGVPGARSPDPALGVTTPGAVSQQFGPNFGKSVTPYRPPPPPPPPPRAAP